MSQKVVRKGAVSEEKDKVQTDGPVKEMKKKMAANAEKEKQAVEKTTDKPAEKTDKSADKNTEKGSDKKAEKNGPVAEKSDKKTEKADKKETPAEKNEAEKKEDSKGEKSGKSDKDAKSGKEKPKQNGSQPNGDTNGAGVNGTVSEDDDDVMLVIDEHEDEMFPELAYDDTSDAEGFEPPTPDAPSRSFTRRSQVKAARTPETPRPASERQPDHPPADDSKESKDSKVLKLKDDASTDRKLRSSDSPKRDTKKTDKPQEKPQDKTQEAPKKTQEKESPKKAQEKKTDEKGEGKENGEKDKLEVDVVIEIDNEETEGEGEGQARKPDTNYSKSRVKVSPYRRSLRIADQTASSIAANYTGNNTTMEMDITETSFADEASLDDSSYLSGLRAIKGRRSYKPLKEMALRHVTANRTARSTASLTASESSSRPTGTVVGRKRKPEPEEGVELAAEAGAEEPPSAATKRMRLLERIAQPFRRTVAATPLPARRAAEIVGINTDLPLSAPVASPDTFDPESLKPSRPVSAETHAHTAPASSATTAAERDAKRCVLM